MSCAPRRARPVVFRTLLTRLLLGAGLLVLAGAAAVLLAAAPASAAETGHTDAGRPDAAGHPSGGGLPGLVDTLDQSLTKTAGSVTRAVDRSTAPVRGTDPDQSGADARADAPDEDEGSEAGSPNGSSATRDLDVSATASSAVAGVADATAQVLDRTVPALPVLGSSEQRPSPVVDLDVATSTSVPARGLESGPPVVEHADRSPAGDEAGPVRAGAVSEGKDTSRTGRAAAAEGDDHIDSGHGGAIAHRDHPDPLPAYPSNGSLPLSAGAGSSSSAAGGGCHGAGGTAVYTDARWSPTDDGRILSSRRATERVVRNDPGIARVTPD